ncbi:MAG: T9SS type A sorting domain-containing protein [Bacteroidales bacterium]|nr:T9SS type A sorting domain-containing protein [Bacteroidales bacterium]
MKKYILNFVLISFLSLISTSLTATSFNLASGTNDGLETKIASVAAGDTIVLTDIGPYNSTSPKITLAKSITIMAKTGLASRPVIKVTATTNQTNFFVFSTGGPYVLNLLGVEFDGNGFTQVLVQSSVKVKITMKNCIVRNFVYPSPGAAAGVFSYSNLMGGNDPLYVEDSQFYNTGGAMRATSTAYPTSATFRNCYFGPITAFSDKEVIYSQAAVGSLVDLNHCTFNGCNYPEVHFANCTATIQNCTFANSTASVAPVLGTANFTDHCAIYTTSGNVDVVYPLAKRDATTILANPSLNAQGYATSATYIAAANDGKSIGYSPKLNVVVSPTSATILKNGMLQFNAVLTDSISAYVPSVNTISWSASSGSISGTGLYTGTLAGSSIAVNANSYGCRGQAFVKVNGVNLTITASASAVYLGYTTQFSSSAVDQDGVAYVGAKSWSVTGGVGTINPSTGLFTPYALGVAVITATIGGYSTNMTVEVVPPTTTISVKMGSDNFSWTFDKAFIEHGAFVDGQPWIVLPAGGANLINVTPARIVGATVKDGTGTSITANINQTVVNPPVGTYYQNNSGAILTRNSFGWDSRGVLRSAPVGFTYDATLAWDGITPLAVNSGDVITTAASLVSQTPSNTVLNAVAVLSVLSSTPPVDAFRPGVVRSAARKLAPEYIRFSDIIDLTPYLITQPTSTILNNPISGIDPIFNASILTNLMPGPSILNAGLLQNRGTNALYNNSGFGYGADVAQNLGDVSVGALASWLTAEERNICRVHLIQRAIDIYESLLAGVVLTYNGGHLPGYGALLTIAGKMLNHSGMININQSINGREPLYFLSDYGQAIYVDDSNINYNDGITPSVGNQRRITSSSILPPLNRITLPVTSASDGFLTINRSFSWPDSRSSSEVQNMKLKVESGPGAGPDYYVVTDMVDFYDTKTDTLTNDIQIQAINGGTLVVKPSWLNGTPNASSVIRTYIATSCELPTWAFKQAGTNASGIYDFSYTLSPTTPYGTINVGAYLTYFVTMYALGAENSYSSGLDRWLLKTMSIPGYGQSIFSDGNSRRPNGTTNYNGSLFLSGLWKAQVLDKKSVSYVNTGFFSSSYAAASALVVPSCITVPTDDVAAISDHELTIIPTVSHVLIHSESVMSQVNLYTLQGVELQSYQVNNKNVELDVSSYNKGCYVIQVLSEGNSVVKKFVLNK